MEQTDLSVVLPAHNESSCIGDAIDEINAYAEQRGLRIEIVIIDDGSTDETAEIIRTCKETHSVKSPNIRICILTNSRRMDKGYAVRRGMLEACGDIVMFCDADLSTPMQQLDQLLPWLNQGFDVVIGSRCMANSVLAPPQPLMRRIMGSVFRWIRKRVMLKEIHDTQCGFKVFSRCAATQIFQAQATRGPAFDCEVLAIAWALGYKIKEVGVLWRNTADSRIRPLRDGLNMLASLICIRWRLRQVTRAGET